MLANWSPNWTFFKVGGNSSICRHVRVLDAKRVIGCILVFTTTDPKPSELYSWSDYRKKKWLVYQKLLKVKSYLFPEGTCLGLISSALNDAKSNSIGAASNEWGPVNKTGILKPLISLIVESEVWYGALSKSITVLSHQLASSLSNFSTNFLRKMSMTWLLVFD